MEYPFPTGIKFENREQFSDAEMTYIIEATASIGWDLLLKLRAEKQANKPKN